MIFSDSRYADGKVIKAADSRTGKSQIAVLRVYPSLSADFYYYTWVEGDRIDTVTYQLTGVTENWWSVMDYNPEILDPNNIAPGTVVRIPRG
jgi:hypothetical protein